MIGSGLGGLPRTAEGCSTAMKFWEHLMGSAQPRRSLELIGLRVLEPRTEGIPQHLGLRQGVRASQSGRRGAWRLSPRPGHRKRQVCVSKTPKPRPYHEAPKLSGAQSLPKQFYESQAGRIHEKPPASETCNRRWVPLALSRIHLFAMLCPSQNCHGPWRSDASRSEAPTCRAASLLTFKAMQRSPPIPELPNCHGMAPGAPTCRELRVAAGSLDLTSEPR